MVDAQHQIPPGILRQSQRQFEKEVIEVPGRVFVIFFFFHFRNFGVIGQTITYRNAGVHVFVPGKRMPASDNQAVEFPQGVSVKVFADLAFDFEADIFFIVPEFPRQGRHGYIGVVIKTRLECEHVVDIVLGGDSAVDGQKPFVPVCVIFVFAIFRQGARC